MADDAEVKARSFWSGTITFGLVSIPVELLPATQREGVSLRMVSPEGTPLQRRYFCSKDDKELDWDDIVRGYEVEKGKFVVVTDDELEKLAPEKTRDIDLRRFVPASEIDPIYFERAYYLVPGGNSTKAYRLLAKTMEDMDRAGMATFVMRGKEYLIAIFAKDGILRAETMRFAEEIRTPADVGLPELVKPRAPTVTKMTKAITSLTERAMSEKELADTHAKKLLALVAKKEKSGEGLVVGAAGDEVPSSEGVIDLMEVLKRSLKEGGAKPARAAKKSARKKSSAGKKTAAKKTSRKRVA
jgi:DNA end-binding protein Ku